MSSIAHHKRFPLNGNLMFRQRQPQLQIKNTFGDTSGLLSASNAQQVHLLSKSHQTGFSPRNPVHVHSAVGPPLLCGICFHLRVQSMAASLFLPQGLPIPSLIHRAPRSAHNKFRVSIWRLVKKLQKSRDPLDLCGKAEYLAPHMNEDRGHQPWNLSSDSQRQNGPSPAHVP